LQPLDQPHAVDDLNINGRPLDDDVVGADREDHPGHGHRLRGLPLC
jgi:hypothetical protein